MSESYWWCPNCREEVDWYHVTYQEQHEACGHLVESISITPEKQERLAELEAELTKVKECNMALHKMMMAKQDLLEAELTNWKDMGTIAHTTALNHYDLLRKADADNARLREIVEYILRLWDGSLNARLPSLINWIDKAKTALREGR